MSSHEWPPLPYADWEPTRDTLHMWTQIVGKTRMALAPLENHWWNVPLYVTPRGLATTSIPYGHESFDVELDFIAHRLSVRTSDGREGTLALFPRAVADFYDEYIACLRAVGIDVRINRIPVEFDDTTPFDEDRHHASYDRDQVERFRRILMDTDRVLKEFRARFLGKSSPVHFFWGSFDLAVTRFSGRRAVPREGTDPVTREAYSHEVISFGFWPGDRRFEHPAFYSYTAPTPAGLDAAAVHPAAAGWDGQLGEFILKYHDALATPSPEAALLEFCQSAYEAGAELAKWDRDALERKPPSGP